MSDHTFVAYIDESGCDGSKFGAGSSYFLILSAVVGFDCQTDDIDLQVQLVTAAAKKPDGWKFPKFEKANPTMKWIMCERFAESPFFAVHVLIHKPSIKSEALRKDRNRLYSYGSKFLIERISWVCDAIYHPLSGDNRKCRIVFSQDLSEATRTSEAISRFCTATRKNIRLQSNGTTSALNQLRIYRFETTQDCCSLIITPAL